MKRITSLLLCIVMCFSMLPSAFAATAPTFYVKRGLINGSEVYEQMLQQVAPDGYTTESGRPRDWTKDGSITVDGHVYYYEVVDPVYAANELKPIYVNDKANATGASLRTYVQEHLIVTQTNKQWESAMGTLGGLDVYVEKFEWKEGGGDYEIPVTIGAYSLTVPFKVLTTNNPATQPHTFYVKRGLTNGAEVYQQMLNIAAPDGFVSESGRPRDWTKDGTFTVDGVTHTYICVDPVYKANALADIYADDSANASMSALQKYVKENIKLTQTNPQYEAALGNVNTTDFYVEKFTWQPTGGTYNLTVTIGKQQLTVQLVVRPVDGVIPTVSISTGGKVTCTPNDVEYSLDRNTWRKVRNGSNLDASCFGCYVYFRTPATTNAAPSDYVTVFCKKNQDAPKNKPTATSNSYSVWITNVAELSGMEFALDDGSYSKTRTLWDNLRANTDYAIHVRYPETRDQFASPDVTVRIKTAEGVKEELKYEKVSTSATVYIQAEGTANLVYNSSSKQMSVNYSGSTVRALKNDITTTGRKTTVVTTLDVYMVQEETDDRAFNKVQFTMPSGMGLLQLRLHTPWFTVIRDEETTDIQLYEGIVDSNSTIRSWGNGLTHVYKVVTTKKGAVQIEFPWEWADRADLDGLRVSYISTDGRDSRTLNYTCVSGGIRFTMPANGYFAIRNLNRPYPTTPFMDVQNHWSYSYVAHAYETKLVAGTSHTTFDPDGLVTRAQLAVLLARLRGYEDGKWYGDVPYTDVGRDQWYSSAVSFLYAAGALRPKDDTKLFDPSAAVTRQDTVALIDKLFPYGGVLWTPFNCTDRDEVNTYALKPLDATYTLGIITGTSPKTFSPNGTLTRAEIVTILYRLQNADYWQTRTQVLRNSKLDSKYVKNTPDIWVDDGAKYFSSTELRNVTDALKYFQTTTGVRPYLVTSTTNKSAEDIYKDKFTDNGHMVILIVKLNDRGGTNTTFYIGGDARTVVNDLGLDIVERNFNDFWSRSTLTASESIVGFLRNTADDLMESEIVYNPSSWEAPKPVDEAKERIKQVVADHFISSNQETELVKASRGDRVPAGFSEWTAVDNTWWSSSGTYQGWKITLLYSKAYSCIRASNTVGNKNTAELFCKAPTANISGDYYVVYDQATASTVQVDRNNVQVEFLYTPPQSIVDQMNARWVK